MKTTDRDRLITVQRPVAVEDSHGGETITWEDVGQAWARVRFGMADEKREAAQEGGSQSATFEVVPTDALLGVRLTYRIQFEDSNWDIKEVAPLDRRTLRFTAVRNL